MKQLGYIVQYLDEDSLTPNGPGKRLFTKFEEAFDHTKELISEWYEKNADPGDGPVEKYEITQKIVDAQHSALVFRSAVVFIWIEIVYA
jgi:hypothetical protein